MQGGFTHPTTRPIMKPCIDITFWGRPSRGVASKPQPHTEDESHTLITYGQQGA